MIPVTYKPKLTAGGVAVRFFATVIIGFAAILASGIILGFDVLNLDKNLGLVIFCISWTAIIISFRHITDYKYRSITFFDDRIEYTTLILQRQSVIRRSELEAEFVPHNQYLSLIYLAFRCTNGKGTFIDWKRYVDPSNPQRTLPDYSKEWFDRTR